MLEICTYCLFCLNKKYFFSSFFFDSSLCVSIPGSQLFQVLRLPVALHLCSGWRGVYHLVNCSTIDDMNVSYVIKHALLASSLSKSQVLICTT